jgi:hypothetical protein
VIIDILYHQNFNNKMDKQNFNNKMDKWNKIHGKKGVTVHGDLA